MQKRTALAISLGLHTAFFAALMYAPPIRLPEKSPSEYKQLFAGNEEKIVWYKFKKLPDIKRPDAPRANRPLRAAVKAEQAIVSSPKEAPKRDQMVVAPVPDIAPPPLDLPNLIAVKLPPKLFTTPPDVVRPDAPKIEIPDAPEVKFEPMEMAKLPSERLPSKTFVPPTPTRPTEGRKIAVLEETPVTATVPLTSTSLPASKLPGRAFVPPVKAAAAPAPTLQIEAPAGDVTIAIAGLNPSNIPVQLPSASSPAQFSAGEKVRPDGAAADGLSKGVTVVPDLFARGAPGQQQPKPELLAMSMMPKSTQEIIDDVARRRAGASVGFHVSNAPDVRFNGREVFMMVIQMPNLTSYSGSWLMWYADRTAKAFSVDKIGAPIPHRKVDPKYAQSLVEQRFQGRVLLYCVIGREGHVSSIEVVHEADARLVASAREALSKWEFDPATRNGEPIDVDVVVEIPFVLAPPPGK